MGRGDGIIVHFRDDEYDLLATPAKACSLRVGPFCRLLLEAPRPLVPGANRALASKLVQSDSNFIQLLNHLQSPTQTPLSVDLVAKLAAVREAMARAEDALTLVSFHQKPS